MKRANHIRPFVSVLVIVFFLAPLITSLVYSSLNLSRKTHEIVFTKTKNNSSKSTDNPLSEGKEKEVEEDKFSCDNKLQSDQFFIYLVNQSFLSFTFQSGNTPQADTHPYRNLQNIPIYIIKRTLLL